MATVDMSGTAVALGAKGVVNGGTVLYGGNVGARAAGQITNAPGLTILGSGSAKTKSSPVNLPAETTGTAYKPGIQTSKGSGTFAFNMVAGQVIGKRLSTKLNGVSNTTLLSGGIGKGARQRSAIHYLETARVLNYNATWNYATGAITKDGTAGNPYSYIDPATAGGATAASDSAAQPTRAIPGELVYTNNGMARTGSLAVALQDDYKAKTG